MISEVYNIDCMDYMRQFPDKFFELAIVDPPYGIGVDGQKKSANGKKSDRKEHLKKNWDESIPSKYYFDELFRVSKNQIIWGGKLFCGIFNKRDKRLDCMGQDATWINNERLRIGIFKFFMSYKNI